MSEVIIKPELNLSNFNDVMGDISRIKMIYPSKRRNFIRATNVIKEISSKIENDKMDTTISNPNKG